MQKRKKNNKFPSKYLQSEWNFRRWSLEFGEHGAARPKIVFRRWCLVVGWPTWRWKLKRRAHLCAPTCVAGTFRLGAGRVRLDAGRVELPFAVLHVGLPLALVLAALPPALLPLAARHCKSGGAAVAAAADAARCGLLERQLLRVDSLIRSRGGNTRQYLSSSCYSDW